MADGLTWRACTATRPSRNGCSQFHSQVISIDQRFGHLDKPVFEHRAAALAPRPVAFRVPMPARAASGPRRARLDRFSSFSR
jgi:hypothetical protein